MKTAEEAWDQTQANIAVSRDLEYERYKAELLSKVEESIENAIRIRLFETVVPASWESYGRKGVIGAQAALEMAGYRTKWCLNERALHISWG